MKFDIIEALVPYRRVRFPDGLKTDQIEEARPSNGVTVDGVLLKDGHPGSALKGATAGNTLRTLHLTITGQGSSQIKCQLGTERFNNDALDESLSAAFGHSGSDTVGADESAVTFALDSGGTDLTVTLPHAVSHVLATSKVKSEFASQHTIEAEAVTDSIRLRLVGEPGGANGTISGLASTKHVVAKIVYVEGA